MKKIIFYCGIFGMFLASNAEIISPKSLLNSLIDTSKLSQHSSIVEILLDFIKKSGKPVILKFHARWCAPCQRLTPTVTAVADHFGDQITIIHIDVDEWDELCRHFQIRYLPTLLYFKDGKQLQETHSVDKKTLIALIKKLL